MRNHVVKLALSILAADFARLSEASCGNRAGASRSDSCGCDGRTLCAQHRHRTADCTVAPPSHTFADGNAFDDFRPDFFLDEFAEAGSTPFLVHWERLGKRARVAINPATPASVLEEILPVLDQVPVTTLNPGFGHQHFLQSTLPKIRRVAQMIEQVNLDCDLGVDGGIDEATAPMVVAAGANVLVVGTSVFGTDKSVAAATESLREAVTQVAQ